MRTLDQIRALFPAGTFVEVLENTRRPELRGQLRRVQRAQKAALDVKVIRGANAGERGFRMALPTRAGDVLELSDTHVRFRIGEQDTVAFRVTDQPAGEPVATGEVCAGCGDRLEGGERERCRECRHEAEGRCRWCGNEPPTPDGELCARCEQEGRHACAAGSFDSLSDPPELPAAA